MRIIKTQKEDFLIDDVTYEFCKKYPQYTRYYFLQDSRTSEPNISVKWVEVYDQNDIVKHLKDFLINLGFMNVKVKFNKSIVSMFGDDNTGKKDITFTFTSIPSKYIYKNTKRSKKSTYKIKLDTSAVMRTRTPIKTEIINGTEEDLMDFLYDEGVDCTLDYTLSEWLENYESEYDPSGSTIVLSISKNGKYIYKNTDF